MTAPAQSSLPLPGLSAFVPTLDLRLCEPLIDLALAEDIHTGDITSEAVIAADAWARGVMRSKSDLVVCGLPLAARVFAKLAPQAEIRVLQAEGAPVSRGAELLTVVGPTRALLSAERTALNFVQRMSGVATQARYFAEAVVGSGTRVVDTRKTLPGWRHLDKYAVAVGGCGNHRYGLYDGILIKNNHITAAGGVAQAVAAAKRRAHHLLRIEVEAATLAQLAEAIDAGADAVLLDNMNDDELARAVRLANEQAIGQGRPPIRLEASGNMDIDRVRRMAPLGLDLISVGALTHSVPAADIHFRIEALPREG